MKKKLLISIVLSLLGYIVSAQCPKPYQLYTNNITTNSITLTWNSGNDSLTGNFEIEYGLKNFNLGTGTKISSSYVGIVINNLNSNTQYDFYVTNNCGGSPTTSDVYQIVTVADYCNGDQFLDPGFGENYSGIYYETYNIKPNSTNQRVILDFEEFQLSTDATLKIWEGSYGFGDPIVTYDNSSVPSEPIVSKATNGELYVVFESNNSQNNATGWIGNVTCVDKPQCDMPRYISSSNITYDSVTLRWLKSTENRTFIEYGLKGFAIGTGEKIETLLNTITISGLDELTEYDFYLTEECDDLSLSDTNKTSVSTKAYCEANVSFGSIKAYEVNQVKISYVNFESSDEWQIEYGLKGFENSSGTVNSYSTEEAIISNLESDTEYDFYLRNKCGERFSAWTGPFLVKTNVDYCSLGKFYDKGGEEQNYTGDNVVTDQYIYLGENERARVLVNSMQLDSFDYFDIYDGPNSNSPLLRGFNSWNHYSFTELVSSGESNVIFIDIKYNSSNTDSKWDIDIICEPAPNCEEVTDFSVVGSKLKHNQCELNWSKTSNPNDSYIIEYGLEGFERGSGITVVTNENFVSLADLNTSTLYQAYITTKCAEGGNNNIDVEPITFRTTPNYFEGDKFTDDGGIDNNIPENQTEITTIYPKADGERIRINFDYIDLTTLYSGSSSYLKIYSGTSTDSGLIVSLKNTSDFTVSGYSFSSEDPNGAITIEFVYGFFDSDYFSRGWEAGIISELIPDCSEPFNISTTRFTHQEINLTWESEADVSEWKIEYGPTGFVRGTGLIKNTTNETVLITDLSPDTEYDFYISSKCNTGNYNDYAGVYKDSTRPDLVNGGLITSNDVPSSAHLAGEALLTTIYPDNIDERIRFEFTYFNLDYSNENGIRSQVKVDFIDHKKLFTHDDFYEFNYDSNLFYPVVSEKEDGTLSIYQNIDGASYWEAKVYSEPKPTCETTNEHGFMFQRVSNNEVEFVWEKNDDNTTYKVEYGPVGFALGTGITKEFDSNRQFLQSELRRPFHTSRTNNNSFDGSLIYYSIVLDNLNEDTEYEFYITTICPDGSVNTYPVPKLVKTTANLLNEGIYATGSSGQMQQRQGWNLKGQLENTTICPNSTDENIVATIKRLDIPLSYSYGDPFTVFNNNTTKDESTILFSSFYEIQYFNNEVVVKANNETGCLTFNFAHPNHTTFGIFPETLEQWDSSTVRRGWFVEISSEPKTTLSLENIDITLDIQFYPNPVKDYFTIAGNLNSKIKEITINDITGRNVKQYFNTNFNEKLNFNLPSGAYFVVIKTEDEKVSVNKIIVKK